jgi:predicted dehydrogenase
MAERFAVKRQYSDHRRMLEECELDGVVVATPHATHAAIAADCLAAGAGVLVEKPFTLDPADAHALVSSAQRQGLPIVVGLPYPFHPDAERVRSALRSGAVGRLVSVTGSFHSMVAEFYAGRPESYRGRRQYPGVEPLVATYSDPAVSGGGQGQTQLSHLVGLMLYELGEARVDRVTAKMCEIAPGIDLAVAVVAAINGSAVMALSSAGTATDASSCTGLLRYDGTGGWIEHDALRGRLTASDPALLGQAEAREPYPIGAPVAALIEALWSARAGSPTIRIPADGVLGARTVEFVAECYRSAGIALLSSSIGTPR